LLATDVARAAHRSAIGQKRGAKLRVMVADDVSGRFGL
jgi:hypothetical protein